MQIINATSAQIQIESESLFTGNINTMWIPLSYEEFMSRYERWQAGAVIQDAFDCLNADEREFIMTGCTPEEWDSMF